MFKDNMKSRLLRYIDAGFPIIYINTYEDSKVDELIRSINIDKEIYEWNEIDGYIDFCNKSTMLEDCTFDMMLNVFKAEEMLEKKIIILRDAVSYMEEAKNVAKLKGIAKLINQSIDATIILIASSLYIPKELEKYITILEMDYLDKNKIKEIIISFAEGYKLNVQEKLIEELSIAFQGMTEFEIKNLLALSYADDGELTRQDLELIMEHKQQMIKKAGILEMIPVKESMEDIGGLENLKQWIRRKAQIFHNMEAAQEYGVDVPKGVLIVGTSGCGKSLNAKAAASLFEVPLLRLDMGRILGKYVGESEENLRKAIELAERISPCILWIDEIEKAFSGIGGAGSGAEVTTRLFGNFLTWMQEKKSTTFVVATANDIFKLPPELLRKGRFDEIFYVGLPNEQEREKIFEIHINRRRPLDLKNIDIVTLVEKTVGFSGADIEGVVKDAIESAFLHGNTGISTKDLLDEIENTHSLYELNKEVIDKLMKEYEKHKFRKASCNLDGKLKKEYQKNISFDREAICQELMKEFEKRGTR